MRKKSSGRKNSVVTRDELLRVSNDVIDKIVNRITKYIDYRLEPMEEMRKEFKEHKNFVSKTLDWIVRNLEKYDQEYTIMSAKYPETNERLDNHEKRISVLEKKTAYKTS